MYPLVNRRGEVRTARSAELTGGARERDRRNPTSMSAQTGPPLIITVNGTPHQIGLPLSERQWLVVNAAEKEQLYGGAKRGGKSWVECIKLMLMAVCFPGNHVGLFRKTLKDLRESTLVTWQKLFPDNHPLILRHHKTQFYYDIRTSSHPSRLYYGGLGDANEVESAKGKEYGAFAIDEPSETDEETYLQLLAQLCWVLPDGSRPPYMAILGSNPEPGWVEERWKDLIDQTSDTVGTAADTSRRFVRALPKDNPYLPPNWERDLRLTVKNKAWVDKYLGGSWEVSEGQLFKEFDRSTHTVSLSSLSQDYLRSLKLFASIDHATTGITCMVIVGADPDSNLIALASYYEKDRLISEHARAMCAMMDEWAVRCDRTQQIAAVSKDRGVHPAWYMFEYFLIDPSTSAKTQQSKNQLVSNQDLYRDHGIPTQQAWNALEPGLSLLQEYMHISPAHVHPFITKPDGSPMLGSPRLIVVSDANSDGIKEIIKFKRTVNEKGQITYVGRDHWLDNVRYIAMSRPEFPERSMRDTLVLDTFAQKALHSHQQWAKTFGQQPDNNQWFGNRDGGLSGRPN